MSMSIIHNHTIVHKGARLYRDLNISTEGKIYIVACSKFSCFVADIMAMVEIKSFHLTL